MNASEREDLALACRMLWLEGHEHFALGHVSSRQPDGTYLLKASGRGLGETRPGDVIVVDQSGSTDEPARLHAEAPIHTEIYRRRPDVRAVVHTHHPAVAAFAASDASFEFVSQDSVYFADRMAFFDSAEMITDADSGEKLASCLADGRAVILRNHGLVTVGASVPEAVFLAISLARSIGTQERARNFGNVVAMNADEIASLAKDFERSYQRRVLGQWEYLRRRLAEQGRSAERDA